MRLLAIGAGASGIARIRLGLALLGLVVTMLGTYDLVGGSGRSALAATSPTAARPAEARHIVRPAPPQGIYGWLPAPARATSAPSRRTI